VVTAAHCVMDPRRRTPFLARQIHFLAGVKGSSWQGHATAKCLRFPPGYEYIDPSKIPNVQALARDLVLIELNDELTEVTPMALGEQTPPAGSALVHASFSADRRHALTAHFECRLLTVEKDVWLTDCDTHAASSGGPPKDWTEFSRGFARNVRVLPPKCAILLGCGPRATDHMAVGDDPARTPDDACYGLVRGPAFLGIRRAVAFCCHIFR